MGRQEMERRRARGRERSGRRTASQKAGNEARNADPAGEEAQPEKQGLFALI